MQGARTKYRAHTRKVKISKAAARKRAIKGWETRRKNDPNLRNIRATGRKTYEWDRPGGEKVSLVNFTPDQMGLMGPGFAAADTHLKKGQKLNTRIKGEPLRYHNYVTASFTGNRMGGFVMSARQFSNDELSRGEKSALKRVSKVEKDAWGNYNPLVMNLHTLNRPNLSFHPAAILTHEIGHLTGPGTDAAWRKTPSNTKGHTIKDVQDFEKGFQWEAPRVRQTGNNLYKDRKHGNLQTSLRTGAIDAAPWDMTSKHPNARGPTRKGDEAGLATRATRAYQNKSPHEDFAESFRSLVGVPTDISGKAEWEHWAWRDTPTKSRRKYMTQHHLSHAAPLNKYQGALEQATETHRKARN